MADDEEEDDDPVRPTARRVAARCGVLVSVAYRTLMEVGTNDAREAHAELLDWMRAPALREEVEAAERAVIEADLGRLSRKQEVDHSWASEAAAVLAWAVGRYELPRYDEQVDGGEVSDAIDFLSVPWVLPDEAILRDPDEVDRCWASTLTLHWRLREHRLRAEPIDLERFVAECEWASLSTEGLDLRDRDLLIRGVPVGEAAEDVAHECLEIAMERHRAFEWLIGSEAKWSDVTTDT
jgi:hypothetical protein